MNKRKCFERILSFVLALSFVMTIMTGCTSDNIEKAEEIDAVTTILQESAQNIDTAKIAEEITSQMISENDTEQINISYTWGDCVGDMDTMVYALLYNEYALCYNVFNARVVLSDGTEVFGIAYTDFSAFYESDGGSGFFPAGFIGLIGEPDIPEEEKQNGLEVDNLDFDGSDYGFVLAYDTEPFMEHCVLWGQYLRYGIDEKGNVTYCSQPYERGNCDETLGSLYSYDEGRFVYQDSFGDYLPITGTTLSSLVDYNELESEINKILEEQDRRYTSTEVHTFVTESKEAVSSYLLSLQEETFMGVSVTELIEMSAALEDDEIIRLTPEGSIIISMSKEPPTEKEKVAQWITSGVCAVIVIGGTVFDLFAPQFKPITAAVTGAATEVFMQLVFENQSLSNVDWRKVGVAAVSGATMAWLCPLASAKATSSVIQQLGKNGAKKVTAKLLGKLAGYGVQTLSTAIVSGATAYANAIFDEKSKEEAIDAMLMGAAIGGAISVVSAAVSDVLSSNALKSLANKKPNGWFAKTSQNVNQYIGEHQIKITNNTSVDDILNPKSVYQAAEQAISATYGTQPSALTKRIVSELPSDSNKNIVKCDADGNVINKQQIVDNGGNCTIKISGDCDDTDLIEKMAAYGNPDIPVKNGDPDFSVISEGKFKPKDGITSNRDKNFQNYHKQLANEWADDVNKIPEAIKNVLSEDELNNITSNTVRNAISKANLTMHEGADGMVYFVDSYIHSQISHSGGVALASFNAKLTASLNNIQVLVTTKPAAIYGTLIA